MPPTLPPAIPRRDFALLFAVLLIVAAGNTAMQSVLPAIGRVIGIPDLLVAIIFSFSALLWTFSAPYWARQSDMRGRKRLMLVGVAGFGVSMLGCALVILAGLKGLILPLVTFALFASLRSLFGVFGSASPPAGQAYVAARTSPAQRTGALATLASAFGLGTILGPAVAPFFVFGSVGLAGPMFAFAIVAILVGAAVWRWLPDDDPTHIPTPYHGAPGSEPNIAGSATGASARAAALGRAPRLAWRDARIAPFMIYGFAIGSIQAATGQALGFLIIDRMGGDPTAAQRFIGIALMAGAAASLLAQWGLIRLLALGPAALLRWGAGLALAGTAGIAVATDFHGIVAAFALSCLGYGFARPGFTAGASLAVGLEEQGAVAGAITSVNGACFILAPAIGIGLYELGGSLPYWTGAAALAALFAYTWLTPVLRRDAPGVHPDTDAGLPHG